MASGTGSSSNVPRLTDLLGIGVLTRVVPRDLVDEILAETGRTIAARPGRRLLRDGIDAILWRRLRGSHAPSRWRPETHAFMAQ